ncbi:MAG: cysteine desulfurase family protein [Clostridia bacterium]|nr:cysteine desulfurase family protein [Clostridia bacterium]
MIYLDNSATTRPFDGVIEAMDRCMRETYFNASAAYGPALSVEREIGECRRAVAAQVGASPEEVIFTSGGTEGDNLAVIGVAMTLRRPSNFAVLATEHPAVAETVRRVEKMGHEVRVLPVDGRGIADLAACEALLSERTALVSCMQVSNETGAIQPIERLAAMARAKNPEVRVHVDGVQGFMRVPMHMARMGVDLYTISGHKIHGPKGVGALVVRKGVRLAPQMTGGGQERALRSGTYNSPAIVGLRAAVREMASRREDVEAMRAMKVHLCELLADEDYVHVNGPLPAQEDSAPHILSLSFEGVRGEVLRNALEGEGILVSTGSACASHKQKVSASLKAMGLSGERADGAIRVSLGLFNTMEEMDELSRKLIRLCATLRQYRRR